MTSEKLVHKCPHLHNRQLSNTFTCFSTRNDLKNTFFSYAKPIVEYFVNTRGSMRLEVLTTALVKVQIFNDVMPYRLAVIHILYKLFLSSGVQCTDPERGATSSPEISATIYQKVSSR